MKDEQPDKRFSAQEWQEDVSKKMWGKAKSECLREKICVICHKKADEFKDRLSAKEYLISGLCQECQNRVFKE